VRYALVIAISIAFASIPAHSQHTHTKNSPCDKPASTAEMANCTQKEWKAEDKKLDAYYQLISKRLEGNELTALQKAQTAWIKYRDLNCSAERMLYEGGTAGSYNYNSCMEDMAQRRLGELKSIYDYWRVSK
jgi:uncharacterized protein YecT (DUF1311 family)